MSPCRHTLRCLPLLGVLGVAVTNVALARDPWWKRIFLFGDLFEDVVAEQTDPATAPAIPTADHPTYYIEYADGYTEIGLDPIAWDTPPPPAVVVDEVHQALTAQHYLPETPGHRATLVLIYDWGVMRERSSFGRRLADMHIRLMLVAPRRQVAATFRDFRDNNEAWTMHFPIINPMEIRLMNLVGDDRYFVIISAYDYASVARSHPRLLWRVRMSTWTVGTSMAEAFPTLLRGGAPYFGRNFDEAQFCAVPKVRAGHVVVGVPRVVETQEGQQPETDSTAEHQP